MGIEGPNVCEIKFQFELSRTIKTLQCKQNEVMGLIFKNSNY